MGVAMTFQRVKVLVGVLIIVIEVEIFKIRTDVCGQFREKPGVDARATVPDPSHFESASLSSTTMPHPEKI